jgi:predicted RNase H-like HicB family nuclease
MCTCDEFTAITEHGRPWYVDYCAEVPGANGWGKSREERLANIREAIALFLEHRLALAGSGPSLPESGVTITEGGSQARKAGAMKLFWRSARLTTCGAAVLLIGYTGALVPSPFCGQEKKASDQKTNESLYEVHLAAEKGDAEAQASLGFMYFEGKRIPQDYAEAVRWYRMAAERGNAIGQASLGDMYKQGRGVAQDYAEAARWYRKAAEQGFPEGQTKLGRSGALVPQSCRARSSRRSIRSRLHLRERPRGGARLRRSCALVPQGCRAG